MEIKKGGENVDRDECYDLHLNKDVLLECVMVKCGFIISDEYFLV